MRRNKGQSPIQVATLILVIVALVGSWMAYSSAGAASTKALAKKKDVSKLNDRIATLEKRLKSLKERQSTLLEKIGTKPPAKFAVTNVSVPSVKAGKTATASVTVINTGGKKGSKDIPLKINGETVKTKHVTIPAGISKTIYYEIRRKQAGDYTVSALGTSTSWSVGVKPISMAVVTDIGGRGDLAFNDMAIRGLKLAKDAGYVSKSTIIVSNKKSDYLPNMRGAARQGYDLVVGVGYMLSSATKTTANEFPDTNFALVDAYPSFKENAPGKQNTLGLLFKAQQSSALVGALGSMLAAEYNKPCTGMALGIEIPVLWDFEAGYKWGVNWAISWMENNQPSALKGDDIDDTPIKDRVLWTYTGTFSDPAAGYNAAKTQIKQGAVGSYNVGGPIGLGIFRAVKEYHKNNNIPKGKPPFGIGVDADQDWIKPGYVIASAMKRVDIGVKKAAKWAAENMYREKIANLNGTWVGGLQSKAVDISSMKSLKTFLKMGISAGKITMDQRQSIMDNVRAMRNAQPDWIWNGVQELRDRILSGQVTVPAVNTKPGIENIRAKYG